MNTAEKNLALFACPLTVGFEPTDAELSQPNFTPRSEEITVRHLRLGKYNDAARALDAGDEIGFTALALGRDRAWVESLLPESYEAVANLVQQVNGTGFFVFMGRRAGRRAMHGAIAGQVDEQLRRELAGRSPSPTASPT